MKNTLMLFLAALVLISLPMFAQEKEKPKEATPSMMPPKPLADDLCAWMVGEWEGWTTSPMGKSKETDRC